MAAFAIALAIFLLSGEGSASIQDHCSDISYWDEMRYETTTNRQCCDTKLQQVCTTKSDQVCQDVLELQCEVVAWGECQSTPTSTRSTKCGVKYNDFAHQNCKEVTTSVSHTKKVPECKEITKNNCVTDWDVDSNGNKIWAGTETCTPVTWEECQIVEKTVEFPTVKTECDVDSHIKWTEFVDITTNIVGLESKCEVKKAVNCKHVLVNKCAPVVWQECKMEPREECLAKVIHTPTQEKIHQQKCLTGDNSDHLNQIRPRNQIHSVPSDPASVLRIEAVAKKDIRAIGELKETIETIEDDLEKNANGLGKRVSIGDVGRVSIRNERFEDYLAGYELVLFNTMNDALFYLKINCGTNAICDGDQIEIFAREIKDAFKKIEATGNVSRWLRQHFSFLKNQIYDAIVEAEGLLKHKLDDFLGSLPRAGGWSEWTEVGECSATCGPANKLIWRSCTNPAPVNGGSECSGSSTGVVSCALSDCAIDGGWTEYSDWSFCSKTCGEGDRVRSRTCTNPPPSNGGKDCLGQSFEVQTCLEAENCPIDGGWNEFSDWSVCSQTCGVGQKVRSRTCTNPPPSFGGEDCLGQSEEVQSCVEVENCPIDGGWTEFYDLSSCSKTCGLGQKVNSRTCTNPPPNFGGEDCLGQSWKVESCVEVECSIDGGWTEFTDWSACSKTCGGEVGQKVRSRTCTNPPPSFGGEDCLGQSEEVQSCVEVENCLPTCRGGVTTLSTSPGLDMVVCQDKTKSTCFKDFETMCPAGWNLCTPGQFNNRNDGWDFHWDHARAVYPLGVIYCEKGSSGGANHYVVQNNQVMNVDQELSCGAASSRPGCDAWAGPGDCEVADHAALCCAPTSTCGDGLVQLEEDCDDGNDSNMDDCLNTCFWKNPGNQGLRGCCKCY